MSSPSHGAMGIQLTSDAMLCLSECDTRIGRWALMELRDQEEQNDKYLLGGGCDRLVSLARIVTALRNPLERKHHGKALIVMRDLLAWHIIGAAQPQSHAQLAAVLKDVFGAPYYDKDIWSTMVLSHMRVCKLMGARTFTARARRGGGRY
jgi:hypothetical protein